MTDDHTGVAWTPSRVVVMGGLPSVGLSIIYGSITSYDLFYFEISKSGSYPPFFSGKIGPIYKL